MHQSLRKAAILICSLDDRTADALLDQMDAEQAAQVRNAVLQLPSVDPAEQERVITEFLGGRPPAALAPAEADTQPPPADRPPHTAPAASSGRPFRFLEEATPDTLAQYLQREHPQTMAVIVAHLPAQRAAGVLARLPAALQADVLRRLARLDQTDPEILRDVEQELQTLLAHHLPSNAPQPAGLTAVQAIFDAADRQARQGLLDSLTASDPQLASQLGPSGPVQRPAPPAPSGSPARPAAAPNSPTVNSTAAPTADPRNGRPQPSGPHSAPQPEPEETMVCLQFDDLAQLDNPSLAQALQACEPQTVLLALVGARSELVARILHQLPAREAKDLQRRMERVGPLRLSDVEQAQQVVARQASQLAARGLIPLPATRRFAMAA